MTLRNTFGAVLATTATSIIALALVPAFALAQSNTQAYTPGNLTVYVQVLNNANNGYNRVASDFTVSVTGTNTTASSFVGSLSGTPILVTGNYSVQVLPISGYNASYSQGCSGSVINNQQASCIVTVNSTTGYNNYPNSYYPNQYYSNSPYNNYYNAPLTCSPSNQTVTVGQSVTFTAQGGNVSQFNWHNSVSPNAISYNIGRTYTTTLLSPGQQSITVTNGEQYAACNVNVVGYPIAGYPGQNGYSYNNGYGITPAVTVIPTYIPRLPNTGFGPTNGTELAVALALLLAAAFTTYPYVRQAFAIVLR